MRNNKAIFFGCAVAVLVVSFGLTAMKTDDLAKRYHQHLEQPSEEELGKCTVCDGKAELCTHLPIIMIETGGQKIPGKTIWENNKRVGTETGDNGETEIKVSISTVDKEGEWHHIDDKKSFEGTALFHIRGNSSRDFDKSSYRVNLVNEKDVLQKEKVKLLGMPSESDWALHGPFLDKTLMRNYMWMNISAQIMGYAPNVRFCEVILDGVYQGVYVLMETISMSEGRTNLTKYEPGDIVSSYMLRIENEERTLEEKRINNYTNYTWRMEFERAVEVLYPGRLTLTESLMNYICTDFSEIERKLYSADLRAGESYSDFLDIDSFVDWYILQEFLAINDAFSASTYFYKDARGKLKIGPVWDYNNALDNFFNEMESDEFILSQRGWYGQLMKSSDFVEKVIDRYRFLRKGVLSEEYLLNYVEETASWLGSAIERNYEVWGYSFDPTVLNNYQRRRPTLPEGVTPSSLGEEAYNAMLREMNPSNYEDANKMMIDYMCEHGKWMDEHIESLRQYCHDSKNAALELD